MSTHIAIFNLSEKIKELELNSLILLEKDNKQQKKIEELELKINNLEKDNEQQKKIINNICKLEDNTNNVTDDMLKSMPYLTSLKLNKNTKVTDEDIKNLVNLTTLNLAYNKNITGGRAPNPYMVAANDFKKWIKTQVDPTSVNNFVALSKVVAPLLKEVNLDVEKAKKNFNKGSFMKEYKKADDAIKAKRAAKKESK